MTMHDDRTIKIFPSMFIFCNNNKARQLLTDLGRRISESSGDARETSFLFQRISVLVQRFNAVLLHDSLPVSDFTDWWSYPLCICLIFKLPQEHIYRGSKKIIIIIIIIITFELTHHGGTADSAEDRLIHDEEEFNKSWQWCRYKQQDVGGGQRHQVAVRRRSHTACPPHDQNHHQVADQTDDEDHADEREADDLVQRVVVLGQQRRVGRRV